MALLDVTDLKIEFPGAERNLAVVDGVSFSIEHGEFVGIVGESGSGKSMTMAACIQLIPAPGRVTEGSIKLDGTELVDISEQRMRALRGSVVSMVLQDPMSALHPMIKIGDQFRTVIGSHARVPTRVARARALEALELVGIPEPARRLAQYPHQLSGGQRQRVMIALAVVNRPSLLLADEPTTALDATLQAQVISLLRDLHREMGLTVALVTHNLGVVSAACDRTIVMESGRVVEVGNTSELVRHPQHPYTVRLLNAVPRVDRPSAAVLPNSAEPEPAPLDRVPLVECQAVSCEFRRPGAFGRAAFRAVDAVSLDAFAGETLALVGESGAGKTTLARCIVKLATPTEGKITFAGQDITHQTAHELGDLRRRIQMVFQDPSTALSPRRTIAQTLAEPIHLYRLRDRNEVEDRVEELVSMVGLPTALLNRYPAQLSGGQRQRVAIARALACEPDLVVADEPVSALDVTIQQQIIELFGTLQRATGLTLIIVAHDMGLVRALCHKVAVMRNGQLIEYGETEAVFEAPWQPYTEQLLAAARTLSVAS